MFHSSKMYKFSTTFNFVWQQKKKSVAFLGLIHMNRNTCRLKIWAFVRELQKKPFLIYLSFYCKHLQVLQMFTIMCDTAVFICIHACMACLSACGLSCQKQETLNSRGCTQVNSADLLNVNVCQVKILSYRNIFENHIQQDIILPQFASRCYINFTYSLVKKYLVPSWFLSFVYICVYVYIFTIKCFRS